MRVTTFIPDILYQDRKKKGGVGGEWSDKITQSDQYLPNVICFEGHELLHANTHWWINKYGHEESQMLGYFLPM